MMLTIITLTTGRHSSMMPAEFYLNLTLFFMLAVFSISFFVLFRTPDEDDIEPAESV